MNSIIRKLAFCALLGTAGNALGVEQLIVNGNFEDAPPGTGYSSFASPGSVVSYPTTGGNPGGYGQLDNTAGSWGAGLVSPPDNFYPNNSGTPLADLGLVAGGTYVFKMDMKNFAGTGTGGLKLESWTDAGFISATADVPATGQSGSWATYSWTYTIAATATRIKFVPLATGASGATTSDIIGFDNIRVDNGVVPPPPIVYGIPNPGFEIPGGASWAPVGPTSFSYPTTGGNPGGYGVMNANGGQWGIWVANSNSELTIGPLGQLPLIAGQTYTFAMDMRIEAGSNQSNIGGFKVDFVGGPGGSTGDMYPVKSGSGTAWTTYSFSVKIPLLVTGVKLVPLWGPNSTVGYDNIRIVDTFAAAIANGFNVSWTANPDNSYQPQSSPTGLAGSYVNIGSPIAGGAGNSVYQAVKAPFYQVQEITPTVYDNALTNPGFETAGATNTGAEGWVSAAGVPPGNFVGVAPSYGSVYPQSGMAMLMMDAVVAAVGSDVRSIVTPVTAGTSYQLRFGVSIPLKSGGASLAYSLFYRDEFGDLIDPAGNKFTNIPTNSLGSAWTTLTQTVVAPAGAFDVTVGFLLSVGADAGIHWVTLFDNVSLDTNVVVSASTSTTIAAATAPAVEVSWPTTIGQTGTPNRTYQVRSSSDLVSWTDFGGPATGNGSPYSVTDTLTPTKKFYQVKQVTP